MRQCNLHNVRYTAKTTRQVNRCILDWQTDWLMVVLLSSMLLTLMLHLSDNPAALFAATPFCLLTELRLFPPPPQADELLNTRANASVQSENQRTSLEFLLHRPVLSPVLYPVLSLISLSKYFKVESHLILFTALWTKASAKWIKLNYDNFIYIYNSN